MYEGDPKLAGVIIEQYPEGIEPKQRYAGKHPASIWYAFWDGNIVAVDYDPDGKPSVKSFWKGYMSRTPWLWKDVDFNYGSDPTFKGHADPRS
jgi:hypothetical protein